MESTDIAKLVNYFNIAAICVMALFAVYGCFAVLIRFSGKNKHRPLLRKKALLTAFCVAALAAFAVEATAFNIPFYLKFFAGPEIQTTEIPPDNPNVLMTTEEGYLADIVVEQDSGGKISSGIRFNDINRKVTSVYADLGYDTDANAAAMSIIWKDAKGDTREFRWILSKHFPHDNHIPLQSFGKVSELTVMFSPNVGDVSVRSVALNGQIPFYFSGLRLLVVSLLLFALFLFSSKELRTKTYSLLEVKFDPANKKQVLIYAFTVVATVIIAWICVYTSANRTLRESEMPVHKLYNVFLTDAMIEGRTWIDHGNPENLLKAERPYDFNYRVENGYVINVDWLWEWAWYEGKYYNFFGIVPNVILYVPYKLITGNYLTIHAGLFLFTAIGLVLLALLWRFLVRKYMPDATYSFFLLSYLALFSTSGIFATLSFARQHSIVQTGAFMFVAAGALLLFKSVEHDKVNRVKLFFACLCFALIAGCRPNVAFVSVLIPIVLWKYRTWKLAAFAVIPFVIVAIPICMYNYVRFGSIFELGYSYVLGGESNIYPYNSILGRFLFKIWHFINYIFAPNTYSLTFPYVNISPRYTGIFLGFVTSHEAVMGMINYPIIFCLFYLFKYSADKDRLKIPLQMLAAGVVTFLATVYAMHSSYRYPFDFMTFITIPALFCAYCYSSNTNSKLPQDTRTKVVYSLLAATVFMGCLYFVNMGSKAIYPFARYLEYSLGLVRQL